MKRPAKLSGDWPVLSRLMWEKPLMVADIHKGSLRRLKVLEWVKVMPRTGRVKLTRLGIYEYRRLLARRQASFHIVETIPSEKEKIA